MMVLSHAIVGAAVGETLNEPLVAFLVMVFIHLIMDKVIHFWPKTEKNGKAFASFDIAITVIFLFILVFYQSENQLSVLAGALGGLIVDVIFVGIPKIKRSKYGLWHNRRQWHNSNPFSLITDLGAMTIGIILLAT